MSAAALAAHLKTGITSVCRAWAVTRTDGVVLGFTDHDRALAFEGIDFTASSGLSARAIEQTTGLSVDNTEAVGALSDPAIREDDIRRGLFDGAEVRAWLVNWQDVTARRLIFRGSLGEIERGAGAFRTELRGLSEMLNQPRGRVYQRPCSAVLGDGNCRFDTLAPGQFAEVSVISVNGAAELVVPDQPGFPDGWFERGRATVLDGPSEGAVAIIKRDASRDAARQIDLWECLPSGCDAGNRVRLEPGCDKRAETCRVKFDNFLNFQGFPDIPGEDWLVSYPVSRGTNDGGSLR